MLKLNEQSLERLKRLSDRMGESPNEVLLKMIGNQEKIMDCQERQFNEFIGRNSVSDKKKIYHISKGRIV